MNPPRPCRLEFAEPLRKPRTIQPEQNGFTLVELLVVTATIALLAAMLLPAVAGTKPDSRAFRCLNNQRQLVLGWTMYASDNGDKLAPNVDSSNAGKSATTPSWVAGWLTLTAISLDNTNTAMLIDHTAYPYGAYLGPYVKVPAVFKCPADRSTAKIFGSVYPRVRSYSMNNFVGYPSRSSNTSGDPWSNPQGNSQYPPYRKFADIKFPVRTFVILGEREDSINDGTFFSDPDVRGFLIDLPANYHGGASGFSFADGHSEMHGWRSAYIRQPILGVPLNNHLLTGSDIVDADWLDQRAVGLASYP